MPLTELIDYINDHLRRDASDRLPEEPIVEHDGRIEGRLGGIRLGTALSRLAAAHDLAVTLGHQASLRATGEDGAALSAPEVFARAADGPAVVCLDRLCRIVHMLNYLAEADTARGLLLLHVDTRHVLSVAHDHGRYFEEVLQRCGLSPERVVLEVAAGSAARSGAHRLEDALASYRRRGYRVALNAGNLTGEALVSSARVLNPHIIKARAAGVPHLASLLPPAGRHGRRASFIASRVDSPVMLRIVRSMGAWAVQGSVTGNPHAEIASHTTHEPRTDPQPLSYV